MEIIRGVIDVCYAQDFKQTFKKEIEETEKMQDAYGSV